MFEGRTLTLDDDRKDYGEPRFQTYGWLNGRIVMVVWTPRFGSRRSTYMTKKRSGSPPIWRDPDDAPDWTAEQLARAELARGGRVIRPATGTLTRARGRPKTESPKVHVSLRIDPAVLERYRSLGPGWQARANEVLKAGAETLGQVAASRGSHTEPYGKVASAASTVFRDPKPAKEAKTTAASARPHRDGKTGEKTGAATGASRVLRDRKASKAAKSVAASALTQAADRPKKVAAAKPKANAK